MILYYKSSHLENYYGKVTKKIRKFYNKKLPERKSKTTKKRV